MNKWKSPLLKRVIGPTNDSFSFRDINISLEYEIPILPHCGSFGVCRKYDVHKGVDLYANEYDDVVAVEDGVVCAIKPFTGAAANCDWWLNTEAINVAGDSGIVVYGEIEPRPSIKMGMEIRAGNTIGRVKRVLKKDKGRPTSMLHLALHRHGYQTSLPHYGDQDNGVWRLDAQQPYGLLDPTKYLLEMDRN